jgi:hypothetical protein
VPRPGAAGTLASAAAGLRPGDRFVGFFFDNHGIDEPVDRALQRGSAVVGRINPSRKRDETFAKIASRLMLTDGIFGIPKLDVHRFELG